MLEYAKPVARLINELNKLPGIGPKTAQRLAFHIINSDIKEAEALASAITESKKTVHFCPVCGNLTDLDPCYICRNPNRDTSIVCVVEHPRDLVALEKTREYKGLYHVLHGVISPMDNVGPEMLKIPQLLDRLKDSNVNEVVIATNPTVEGEATAMYLARLIKPLEVKVTRIAHGLPVGGDLEYADQDTLTRAFEGRREL
ncbi:MAG: recombination protein RecR [Clostridia bacterium]|jgi:recombination protein RecR|nr:recombination protein RecR [Clostridiales bacterium]MDK2985782.1 recombination protein RecR [Clostridia bacterium]